MLTILPEQHPRVTVESGQAQEQRTGHLRNISGAKSDIPSPSNQIPGVGSPEARDVFQARTLWRAVYWPSAETSTVFEESSLYPSLISVQFAPRFRPLSHLDSERLAEASLSCWDSTKAPFRTNRLLLVWRLCFEALRRKSEF